MNKRKIKLGPDERHSLMVHYVSTRIPIDQFAQRPAEFLEFVRKWNGKNGSDYSPEDVRHYMLTQRKAGSWPTMDGKHKRLKCPPDDFLSEYEWSTLAAIYIEFGRGRDVYAVDMVAVHDLEVSFLQRVGRHISGSMLYAALMMLQKSGRLAKLDGDVGFGDIGAIG